MSKINVRDFHNENEDGAPDIVGVSTFSSTAYFVPTKGTTAQRPSDHVEVGSLRFNTDTSNLEYYRGDTIGWSQFELIDPELGGGTGSNTGLGTRALFFGRAEPSITNRTDFFTISTLGDAQDFGDMNGAGYTYSTAASRTRGIVAGGQPSHSNVIDLFTFASTGNAIDTGNLTSSRWLMGGGCSDLTRAIFTGGSTAGSPNPVVNTLDYITMASGGDAVDFGDQTTGRRMQASVNSSTRGVWAGGYSPFDGTNLIDYVTISSTGNALDFGDQTHANREGAGVCNSTRGVFMGGGTSGNRNIIDFITIATTGNAQDFGDLLAERRSHGCASSPTRGVAGGAYPNTNGIEYITILTTGNSLDFGDLTAAGHNVGGTSNGHGGL